MEQDMTIPVAVSARHAHLSRAHVDALFGPGHTLVRRADLAQPGQYACEETVTVAGPRGEIAGVRVLGPERKETQVEISRTDELKLGIDAPIRDSGAVDGSPGLRLIGPAGEVVLQRGAIQAKRHAHMSPADAARFGVADRQVVMARVGGERGVIFDDVVVRVDPAFVLELHLDTDEANAADVHPGARATLLTGPTTVKAEPAD